MCERERGLNEISSEREVHVFRLFIFHMFFPILQPISMIFFNHFIDQVTSLVKLSNSFISILKYKTVQNINYIC